MGIVGITYPIDKVAKEEFEAAEETLYMQIAPLVGDDVQIPERTPTAFFLSEDGGTAIALPYAPNSYSIGGIAGAYSTIQRAGDKPLTIFSNDQLLTVNMELYIAPKRQNRILDSVDAYLTEFRRYVRQKKRWKFVIDGQIAGIYWYFTQVDLQSKLRRPTDNELSVATLSVSLTEASDLTIATGPVDGGVSPTDPNPDGAPNRTHTVKSGDYLWNLAVRYLGSGKCWPDIAKLNNITDPRTLRVGQLKIPTDSTCNPLKALSGSRYPTDVVV